MIRFNLFNQGAALGALLLCFSLVSAADDMQDASTLLKQGQTSKALSKIDSILAKHPKEAQARFLKGVIMTEQGKTEDAIRIFSALTADYPELPEPYNNLAVIYANQSQFEKAKTALEAALRTHPSYSTAHENLGDIYAQMASQAYSRALQLDRNNDNSKTKLVLLKDMYSPPIKAMASKTLVASLPAAPIATTTNTTATLAPPVLLGTSLIEKTQTEPNKAEAVKSVEPATTNISSNDELLQAVQIWAKAWSSRNANKYLTMYAKDFKAPNNESRGAWEKQRRDRIDKPQAIVVTIINARVKIVDETHASVSFVQAYRSGSFKSTTRKTLTMTKENNAWKIQSEQTGV